MKNPFLRKTVFTVLFAALLSALIVWWAFRDQSLTLVQKRGLIRIGYSIEVPYAFLKPNGEVAGESPEVAKRVVARLGIPRIEWRYVKFASLIPELESGRIDVIASGMFITPERAKRVRFSEPTFHVRQALLVLKGNPHDLHSYEQALQRPGIRIAAITGSVEEILLRHLGYPEERLVSVPDALTGRVVVESGNATGLALSAPSLRSMMMQDPKGLTEIAQPFNQPKSTLACKSGYGGFGFRLGDRQLQEAWNRAQEGFIGSQEHLELIRNLGFGEIGLPGSVTTEEVLSP